MKKNTIKLFFLTLLVSTFLTSSVFAKVNNLKELEQKELSEFNPPKVTKGQLKNGIKFFFLEDKALPIINLGILIKTGSIYEPVEKLGLANLLGTLIRTSGTKRKSPEKVDTLLDNKAATITSNISTQAGNVELKILSKDLDNILPLFFEMVFEPGFEDKRVKYAKINLLEDLKRENDFPGKIVDREFSFLIYGKNSSWARRPDIKTIKSINKKDLKEFHSKYFVPQNMILYASGDFNKKTFLRKIESLTNKYPNKQVLFPKVEPVKYEFKKETKNIKKDISQTYLELGHLGIKRHNPDKFALEIMNMVLGSLPFKSRLMQDIRSDRGLAYKISSHFGWNTDYGMFRIKVDTKSQNTKKVIKLIKKHLKRIAVKSDITQEEVDLAKESVLNRLVFEFDNSFKIASQRARFEFFGYPQDYFNIYKQNIEKLTLEDINKVAAKYIHPKDLKIVIVGKK